MRENSSKVETQKSFIDSFVRLLPSDSLSRHQLLLQYQKKKGYRFLNPQSKYHGYFMRQMKEQGMNLKRKSKGESERKIVMEGRFEELSVGGMCEMLKQRIRQGKNPYQPIPNQFYLQQITYTKDINLQQKANKILHSIQLLKLKDEEDPQKQPKIEKGGRIQEFRKQMVIGEDGSMGPWGGKKYEGLGIRNEFSEFRREQSLSFYQNASERKKI